MNSYIRYFLSISLVLLFSLVAFSKELKGMQFDDQVEVAGTKLVLNGLGVRKAYSMFDVYVGGLYLAEISKDSDAIVSSKTPKRIVLKFKRFVEKGKMKDAWTEGFLKNADKTYTYKEDLQKLNEAMSQHLKEGDAMTFTFFEDKAEIKLKDEPVVTIPGGNFSKTMLKVFINKPPDEDLKKGMLGL